MFQKRKINLLFFLLPVIIIASLATIIIVFAWTEPTQTPPGDNVPAPLNIGSGGQSKVGGLILNTGGATTGLIIDKGRVGIGTSTPATTLHIIGQTRIEKNAPNLQLIGSDSVYQEFYPQGSAKGRYGWLGYGSAGTETLTIMNQRASRLDLGTNSVVGLSIISNGNVGIATTTPEYKLDVYGDINLPATGFLRIAGNAGSSGQVLARTATGMDWQAATGGGVGGSGTALYIPKFTDDHTLGNSQIIDNGTDLSIGPLAVGGTKLTINSGSNSDYILALLRSNATYPSYPVIFKVGTDSALVINAQNSNVLTIKGGTGEKLEISGSDSPSIKIQSNTNADYYTRFKQYTQWSVGQPIFEIYNSPTVEGAGNVLIGSYLANVGDINQPVTALMRGNVGIGTQAPATKLEVFNTSDSILRLTRYGAANPTTFRVGTNNALVINNSGIDTLALLSGDVGVYRNLGVTGNVGIGTAVPAHKLSIMGGYQATGLTGGVNGIHISGGGGSPNSGQIVWGNATGYKLNFGTRDSNGTFIERLTIKDTGYVGINTNNPLASLDIRGASASGDPRVLNMGGIYVESSDPNVSAGIALTSGGITQGSIYMGHVRVNGHGSGDAKVGDGVIGVRGGTGKLILATGASGAAPQPARITIDINGNVGIGTTSPGVKLDVSGDIRTNAGITLGGVRRTSWPGATTKIVDAKTCNPSSSDPGEVIATADCGAGWVLTGCSGFHEWGYCAGKTCDFRGVIPSGKTCTAYAFTRPEGCIIAHAICMQ